MIRLARPSIDDRDVDAVAAVSRAGSLVQGQNVELFEHRVADYVGTQRAVALNSGTSALHLALLALGVGDGDVVAVPAYSFPATANAAALCGATPLFVDIDPDTFNMSADALDRALSRQPAKVVMPVHAFGGMADMAAIQAVADRHGAAVVEDAACAIGSNLNGRRAGSFGRLACFSFHPRKVITTGEGGMVTTDDPELADRIALLRNHGMTRGADGVQFTAVGYNLRLTDFQAALGLVQMDKLDTLVDERRALAGRYAGLLQETSIVAPVEPASSRHTFQSYVVRLPIPGQVARVIAELRERGIEATIGTYNIPRTTWYREHARAAGSFPATDRVFDTAISLPLHPELEARQQELVVERLLGAVEASVPAAS